MCGRGVVWERASSMRGRPTEQQQAELRGDAAGEGGVDPGVGARVQAGQKHQQRERRICEDTYWEDVALDKSSV